MKRRTCLLGLLVLPAALYAQADGSRLTREQVLDVFARFNPSVLEQARQDEVYRPFLERFLSSYQGTDTPEDRWELISVVRNFDNSFQLDTLKQAYKQIWMTSQMTGSPLAGARQLFLNDVSDVLARVWAVTVQVQEYRLAQSKQELKELRREAPSAQGQARQAQLQQDIQNLRPLLRALKKNPGQQLSEAAEGYVAAAERAFEQQAFTVQKQAADQAQLQATATTNLQIKSNHKKPVAE